ncbi:hypothetical protein YB2330_003508 [Saitoella coloradoensis]
MAAPVRHGTARAPYSTSSQSSGKGWAAVRNMTFRSDSPPMQQPQSSGRWDKLINAASSAKAALASSLASDRKHDWDDSHCQDESDSHLHRVMLDYYIERKGEVPTWLVPMAQQQAMGIVARPQQQQASQYMQDPYGAQRPQQRAPSPNDSRSVASNSTAASAGSTTARRNTSLRDIYDTAKSRDTSSLRQEAMAGGYRRSQDSAGYDRGSSTAAPSSGGPPKMSLRDRLKERASGANRY